MTRLMAQTEQLDLQHMSPTFLSFNLGSQALWLYSLAPLHALYVVRYMGWGL